MSEATPSEYAASEMPATGEATPAADPMSFPPYPPYAVEPVPPSVADTIIAGRDLRVQHKSQVPKRAVRPPPKPAKPRGPKATDVKLKKRAARAHARCLRRYNAVLTDRMERMSKPPKRSIIYLWRDYAHVLPADTIARLRSMLDADEPFKPEQAYEYFINLKKTKKRTTALKVKEIEKDVLAMCADKRFVWARNATVAFARGIQQRLSRPGRYALADGMLRLSNIILNELCGIMHMKTPSRRCTHPKAKFIMEMSDKVAVWIDEVLSESDDRMLMMDFDEDEDVLNADEAGDTGFTDDFLNMMGGAGGLFKGPKPAYLNFTGEMLEAFMILTDAMSKKGDKELFSYGKCKKTYLEGVDELKRTPDFDATEFNSVLAQQLNKDLADTAQPDTPSNLAPFMKDMVNICANYLAQYAEFNKDKGPAFQLLVKQMKTKGNEQLYQKEKARRTYGKAAIELEESRGLETDHDDPNLSQEIHTCLTKLVDSVTPAELKADMKETLDICSKYLSQRAIDEIERGPAFDLLIKVLESQGAEPFTPEFKPVGTMFAAAYTLKSAPGLSSVVPDTATVPIFTQVLHRTVDSSTPQSLVNDMGEVINRCANYLSAFVRDRDKVLQSLLKMMKGNPSKELAKRSNYSMTYGTGAIETETAPTIVPFLPVKDIADEAKGKLTTDMESSTPPELKIAMKSLIQDVSRHLSQPTALRSGVAGERYPLAFLTSVKQSLGGRPLFKYKVYGQSYGDAANVLKYAGPLEKDPKSDDLQYAIKSEMSRGVPSRLPPTVAGGLSDVVNDAATHLASIGVGKGNALEYLVNLMKEQGEANLGTLQGYQQSYNDGARRIENSTSLANEKVDKGAYESVRTKLTTLATNKPAKEHEQYMTGIIDESAKFLAAPLPETESEKRQVLADLLGRKGNEIIGKEGLYKLTHQEAGKEIIHAPVGVVTAYDAGKKKEHLDKINLVIPDKKMQDLLKVAADEGSAYITDLIKGRGEAMQVIHDDLKKENGKDFLTLGKFKKNYAETADMLKDASHFGGKHPLPVIMDKVKDKINAVPAKGGSPNAQKYMSETKNLTSHYIAGIATDECGLDAKALAAMDTALMGLGKGSRPPGFEARASQQAAGQAGKDAGQAGKDAGGLSAEELARKKQEDDERRKREEEERRRQEEERKRQEEERKLRDGKKGTSDADATARRATLSTAALGEYDPERDAALAILHKQLQAKGAEMLYKQPHTELTHAQASTWLSMKPPMKVDKTVKESGDTARLHKKFERKLSVLVSKCTPEDMQDTMQDVVIESARILSEYFVSKNYKALVKEGLISEMQKRGNEILVEVDGSAETFFFAAQRLKKATSLDVKEPCDQVSYLVFKKLDDMIRCRTMARKLTATMKDHAKEASDYLSELVTKPNPEIEAYVSMLAEMETTGDALLIEGDIPKSFKDSAVYLRQLTSYEDQIKRSNRSLQSSAESKLQSIMANVPLRGYTKSVLDGVISSSMGLLVSYIMLQGEKTVALKILIGKLDDAGDGMLLRHGNVRKTYADGADRLRGKNADQLSVVCADPVVARKLQIKLHNLMRSCTPPAQAALMDDVIEDATMYLAVHLLQPRVIQVCKCMKNVFVQCELWCDEILRRVARPCCTCSRHVSAQALADLSAPSRLHISPSGERASAPGLEISLTQCPSRQDRCVRAPQPACPAPNPTPGCSNRPPTTTYMLHTVYHRGVTNQLGNGSTSPSFHTPGDSPMLSERASPQLKQVRAILAGMHDVASPCSRKTSPSRSGYSTRTPIISTDQMSDWHAMMVSLMWNVQAWRDWIQENIDRALAYRADPNVTTAEAEETWACFQRRVATEALQWRQYNIFSQQLTLRLSLRYRDKQIVSPTRATDKTETYMECQREMLEIIEMFNRWTHWLIAVIKETNLLHQLPGSDKPLHELRWDHFKEKVQEYSEDWIKYNTHLKVCWEHKYMSLISDWLPAWKHPGPVWVVSACGAVPSGAVSAGLYDSELVWVARTTHSFVLSLHRCNVLPGALHPSKHCCIVYADGAVHHYTKYQVMCNASARWVAWRAGALGARAVRVAAGVHVGRVLYRGSHLLGAVHAPHYRCHVVIFGRPFAFNCYELLVLEGDED